MLIFAQEKGKKLLTKAKSHEQLVNTSMAVFGNDNEALV